MTKQFLYLTNDKLVALIWKSGAIVERDVFGATELEHPAFMEYVDKHRDISTHVVTDLIEEDFRLETVPHLRGNDQDSVMARKLSQLYRASPFRHGIIQGREAQGRRDDKVLYHAVTNPELLKPLLAVLERAGDEFTIEASENTTLLILNGEPFADPVVGYGPFVMNTRKEIEQAIADFQSGKMGHLAEHV